MKTPRLSFRVVRRGRIPLEVVDSPLKVAARAYSVIPDDGREHFGVMLFDNNLHLLGYHEVSVGGVDRASVLPRDVFAPALRTPGCASVVAVHNHPTGLCGPSRDDIALTAALARAGKLLDIPLHDHVIIGNATTKLAFYSFSERRRKTLREWQT